MVELSLVDVVLVDNGGVHVTQDVVVRKENDYG
jgi:hypothetical protein